MGNNKTNWIAQNKHLKANGIFTVQRLVRFTTNQMLATFVDSYLVSKIFSVTLIALLNDVMTRLCDIDCIA